MMETPLDVLSRAASAIEYCGADERGSGILKRGLSGSSSAPEFLLPQLQKCRRLEPVSTVDLEPSPHLDCITRRQTEVMQQPNERDSSRRCAGTQTQFSSFVPYSSAFYLQPSLPKEIGTNEEEPRLILDLDRQIVQPSLDRRMCPSSRCYGPPVPPIFIYPNMISSIASTDSNNAPLNLSIPSSSKVYLGLSQQRSLPEDQRLSKRSASCGGGIKRSSSSPGGRRVETTPVYGNGLTTEAKLSQSVCVTCDEDIEEHFQRSLGKDYPKCLASNSSATTLTINQSTPRVPDVKPENLADDDDVREAVDDHFEKSLGNTWKQISSRREDACGTTACSVDDHFAKALGAAWFKLKAEKQTS